MAATTLTVQHTNLASTGLVPTFSNFDKANGNQFANSSANGNIVLLVKNASATLPVTLTITAQADCNMGFSHDAAVTVPANTPLVAIGPFPTSRFNDGNGRVQIAYTTDITDAAEVQVAAVNAAKAPANA